MTWIAIPEFEIMFRYRIPNCSIILLGIFLLAACSNHEKKKNAAELNKIYGEKLIEAGFLSHADTLQIDSLSTDIVLDFNIYNEGINRLVFVDAEELAEFNFDFFLPELNHVLSSRNMEVQVTMAENYDASLAISLNGQEVQLYTHDELKTNSFWDAAARNFFTKVNLLLKSKETEERFYLLYGGNDLHVFLLTEQQCQIIAERYEFKQAEIPYLPE